MSMRCFFLLFTFAAAAPFNSSGPKRRDGGRNILTNFIQDLESLKSDVLSIITPTNISNPNRLNKGKPSKHDFNISPSSQFSQTSNFVAATTEAPKQEQDDLEEQVDLTGPSLYREDVVKKAWHYKKSRNLASEHNSI